MSPHTTTGYRLIPTHSAPFSTAAVAGQIVDKARHVLGKGFDLYGVEPRVEQHARNYACMLKELHALARRGRLRAARALVYRILKSHSARICAAILSRHAKRPKVGYGELVQFAASLDCRRPSGEPVFAWAEPKSNGGWRPVVNFGPRARACQRLVLDILRAWLGEGPFDFARKGRGRDKAINHVLERIKNGGARWFITADIRNFYRHINPEELDKLVPLPKSVIRNVLAIPESTKVILKKDHPPGLGLAVREGIPQGSLASAFIAAKVVEGVLQQLPARVSVGYADNALIGSKTQHEAKTTYEALAQLLHEHPVGPLLLKEADVFQLGQPNDFLRYRLHRLPPSKGGYAYAHPSPQGFAMMFSRLRQRLQAEPDDEMLLAVGGSYLRSWLGSQGAWKRSSYAEALVLDHADIEAADEHSRRHPYIPPPPSGWVQEVLAKVKAHV